MTIKQFKVTIEVETTDEDDQPNIEDVEQYLTDCIQPGVEPDDEDRFRAHNLAVSEVTPLRLYQVEADTSEFLAEDAEHAIEQYLGSIGVVLDESKARKQAEAAWNSGWFDVIDRGIAPIQPT